MLKNQQPKFRIYNQKAGLAKNEIRYEPVTPDCVFSNNFGKGIAIEVEKDGTWATTVEITVHPEKGLCVRMWDKDYMGEYWTEQERLVNKLAK